MIYAENRKALHDYEVLETFEAGLVLAGYEVKSVRNGQVSLKGTHVNFYRDEPYVINMHISKYKPAGSLPDYDPEKRRKLLLRKRQLSYLFGKTMEKGLRIVPLKVYNSGRLIKIEIAVVRGRKQYDKREMLKNRDIQKEIKRTLKYTNN